MVNDPLTSEQALQIIINNEPITVTMRTPGNDDELITGLLYNEDIYKHFSPLNIDYSEIDNTTIAKITIEKKLLGKGYLNKRSLLSVASCGICGKTELTEVKEVKNHLNQFTFGANEMLDLFEQMKERQATFDKSGGSHAAACFNSASELLSIQEDIGRHNAVDKVVGELLIQNNISSGKILTVSGRVSYEIVIKCFAAKIPILASVSAPSTLAVDYTKELGITLLSFCRENRFTCYSNPERII